MKLMNSVSIGSSDLGTPGYNFKESKPDAGMLDTSDPTKDPVEYISSGGPADTNQKGTEVMVNKGNSSEPSGFGENLMSGAMLRRLTQFFTR